MNVQIVAAEKLSQCCPVSLPWIYHTGLYKSQTLANKQSYFHNLLLVLILPEASFVFVKTRFRTVWASKTECVPGDENEAVIFVKIIGILL